MNNMFKSMAILALGTVVSFAGPATPDAKDSKDKTVEKKIEDQGIYVETNKKGVVLSGYVDAGYSLNTDSNSPVPAALQTGGVGTLRTVQNSRFGADAQNRGGFNLNAFKLALEKPLGDKNDFNAGFRADLMYGQDASFLRGNDVSNGAGTAPAATNSLLGGRGNDLFVEQAFVQFRAPVGNGLDFKVGRFVTPMGYEVIERPANLNISYGNLFQNMIPIYHQGVMASYKFNDTVNVSGAVVNGWNDSRTQSAPGFGGTTKVGSDNYGVIGTLNVNAPGGNANIQQAIYLGSNGDSSILANSPTGPAATGSNNNGVFVYDVWGNWKPKFANDKWLLGYNADYGRADYDNSATSSATEQWYGIALYSKYQFTKIYSVAGRADWIHNTNGAKWGNTGETAFNNGIAGGSLGRSNDVYSYTLTNSFDVWENMLLRAEYRADFGNDWGVNAFPSNGATASRFGVSHLFSAQVVYSF